MAGSVVHIVHCVDTEGPLYESLDETFSRLNDIFGIDLPPSRETLRALQEKRIDLGGLEDSVATVFSPKQLTYNATWDQVDSMLDRIQSHEFRHRMTDSFGGGWVYSWHCLDVVGFDENPRRRAMGFHAIFDHYRERLRDPVNAADGLHFHFHPMTFSRKAHHSATHYFANSDNIFQVLARRILDRSWFPSCNRPGFHVTRPDSNWFFEQFIPFDLSSQATEEDYSAQKDVSAGRFGDWRRAPRTWSPYHPSHDDYQVPGSCRRWITRCLNLGSRVRELTQADVDQAFTEAAEGKPVVLAFTNHDFRELGPDIDRGQAMIKSAAERHPGVQFRFCESRGAMRGALGLSGTPLKLDMTLAGNLLTVRSDADTFGPQPFLAIRDRSGRTYHDNFDFQVPLREWSYTFDENSLPVEAIEKVGVASCNAAGDVTVSLLDAVRGGVTTTTI